MKKKKAWSGRFKGSTNPLVEEFNASIGFDWRLYKHDIRASIAHASMLGARKIITKKDSGAIIKGLKQIEKEIDSCKFAFEVADEDIHMAIERRLTKIIGSAAGKLHTARSRNDQVATDLRLFVRDSIDEIIGLLHKLQETFYNKAKEHMDTIAPSYTHLQPAQPIRLAHWFLAYYEMLKRDAERFADARKRVNVMPLGSAALAGTNFPIGRDMVAKELGFASISENSLDAVSDRDFAVEFLFVVSMTATHLSRLAEELVIFTSSEFSVMELPDAFCTGSSIMPQKKNPDVPELVRGKTGRLNGNLLALLTTLKGLPLAYNKDLQEDKEPVFDSYEQLAAMLEVTCEMMSALKVDVPKLGKRANENFMMAVDVADKLSMGGVPFRKAHEIVGRLVRLGIENGWSFSDITREYAKKLEPSLVKALSDVDNATKSTDNKDVPGGTARKRIAARLKKIEREMKKW